MTTLREQITADVADVFMQVDDFAEDVTYIPGTGASRTVTCVIEEEQEYFDTELDTQLLERIRVFVPRTAAGIQTPKIGDKIKRSAAYDATQELYGYEAMIEMPEPDTHWLLFKRKRRTQVGVSQKGERP
jgi:hypothetical protein